MAWGCVNKFGLTGAGIAFFGSYVFHGVLIYVVVRRLSGFEWSLGNKNAGVVFIGLVAGVFGLFYALPLLPAVMIGVVALLVSTVYSIRTLTTLVSIDQIPRPFQRILAKVGLLHSSNMPSGHL